MGKLTLLIAIAAASACAATPDETAIQNTFVKPWIEALRSKDAARIRKFYHPRLLACMNADNKPYFDSIFDGEMSLELADPYRITKMAPMQGPMPAFLPEDGFPIPVKPTYEVDIEFEKSSLIVTRFLARSHESWYVVYPCPNEKGMAFMRQNLAEGAEQKKKAARLLADLKDPLRSQLNELLRQQQKIDAIKKYQAAAGVNLSTAVMVIDGLQKSGR